MRFSGPSDKGKRWIKEAIKTFGLADNPDEAGYILRSGAMLDFSGKRIGGSPSYRNLGHRDIWQAMRDSEEAGGTKGMDAF